MKNLFVAFCMLMMCVGVSAENQVDVVKSKVVTPHFWGDQKFMVVNHNDSTDRLDFKTSVIRKDDTRVSFSGFVASNNMGIKHVRYVRRSDSSTYVVVTFADGHIERWSVASK